MRPRVIVNDAINDIAVSEGLGALQHLYDTYRNRRPERESDDFDFNVHVVRFDYIQGTASFARCIDSPDEPDEVFPLDHVIQRIQTELAAGPRR